MSELNVGGSNMTVELRENTLYAESNTGNKQWVAVLTDTHPKYNYDRKFVAYQKPKTSDRDSGTAIAEDGAVIERVRFTHSGKNRKDRFYQLVDGEVYQIDEVDVEAAINGEIVADVPEDETHECEECGDEFDSEHGVAVHKGIVHSDDEVDETDAEEPATAERSTDSASPTAIADGGTDGEPVEEVLDGGINEVIVRTLSHGYRFTRGGSDEEVTHIYCGTVENDAEIPIGDVPPQVFDALEDAGHNPNRETTAHPAGRDISLADSESGGETDSDDDTNPIADGGLVVREFNEVRHSDELVREYRTPPGDRLYAYRSDDGDHHIVVSRGDEPGTRWEKRFRATVERPIPGQKLWTIPDNWEKRVHSKRDSIAYGLFYVPDSDTWARVSIPTNDWLTDAWYRVKAVGDLDVEPVGELASSYELRQHADDYEQDHNVEPAKEDAELLRKIADNWSVVEEDLRLTTEWVRDEGLDQMQPGDQPIHADRDWQIEFHQDEIFKPLRALGEGIDFDEYDIPASALLEELRDVGLPSHYSFELTLDDSAIDMEYYTRGLIEAGASPAEAMDYYMVEIVGMTQTAWAKERGVDQSTVSGNVSQAKEKFK